MNLPRKVFFFGLRKQFNATVSVINAMLINYGKVFFKIVELETRLEALERKADINDLLDGVAARYDEIIVDEITIVEEEETDAPERTED